MSVNYKTRVIRAGQFRFDTSAILPASGLTNIVNPEWTTVPDSGHSIAWEQPEIFKSNVLRFLKGCHGESVRSAATEEEPFVIPPWSVQ
jgi:hypothetical protein